MVANLIQLFAAGDCPDKNFLGLLPWYHYLSLNKQCGFDASHPFTVLGGNSSILLILLAVVDDLFRIIGLLAVVFIIYAGIQFVTSNGSPDEAAKARGTLINALVGLAIAAIAIAFVSYLGNVVGPGAAPHPATSDQIDVSVLPNPGGADTGAIIPTILSIVFVTTGGIAMLIIVIAGYRYILAQGDPQATAQAKSTIIYALVGLLVAITAQSIVSVVLNR